MLFLLLLVSPAYAQEEKTEPPAEVAEETLTPPSTEEQLEEQVKEIEEQMEVQVGNTMAICQALGITCEEEAAGKLIEALNDLVVIEPPEDTQSPEMLEDEDG